MFGAANFDYSDRYSGNWWKEGAADAEAQARADAAALADAQRAKDEFYGKGQPR